MWFIAGDGVSRIPVFKELSIFKTLGTFAKSLEMNRDWVVTQRGGAGSWRGCDMKTAREDLSMAVLW